VSAPAQGCSSNVDSDSSATLFLDPRIYTRDAILRACYWHSGVAYIQVPESPDDRLIVRLTLKHKIPTLENPNPIRIDELTGEFCNSLLDFELRRQVEAETAGIRQLIVAKAFSESGVLEDDPPGTFADPVENEQPSSFVQLTNNTVSSRK
jgi:His-Xaa-Ser system protein HxsD